MVDEGPKLTIATPSEAPAAASVRLCGAYRHAVDAKGRVAVPVLHRRGLPDGSVVGPNSSRRLGIWPADQWELEVDRYRQFAETTTQRERLERQIFALTFPFEVDAQGRMLLTAAQRKWASITAAAVFLGLGRCVEIVGEEVWDAVDLDLDPAGFNTLHALVHRADERVSGTPQ